MGCSICECNNIKIYDFSNPSETYVREIFYKLRIRKISKDEFLEIMNKNHIQKFRIEKILFVKLLENTFYETNPKLNVYKRIHSILFDLLVNEIEKYYDRKEIIIKIFPILKTTNNKEVYYINLIKEYFGKEILYGKLHNLFVRCFEFYSFKINKIIMIETENEDLRYHTHMMNEEFFNHGNIVLSVDNLFKYLIEDNKNIEKIFIKRESLNAIFKEYDILSFEGIRDYLIDFKLNNNVKEK